MNVLWVSGRLPTPLFSGDALYSAGLIKALSLIEGAHICVVGTQRHGDPKHTHEMNYRGVSVVETLPPNSADLASLLSMLPKDAFNLATSELRCALQELLGKPWDWIVLDHANSGGLLGTIMEYKRHARVCYVAHNAEGKVRPEVARSTPGLFLRAAMTFDARKYKWLEQALVKMADVVICISDADVSYFQGATELHVVPPIYLGGSETPRSISIATPRELLLLGSFEWIAKQRNLTDLVRVLAPTLQSNGIRLNVVGSIPSALEGDLSAVAPIRFHGLVPDVLPFYRNARGGLVAETLGGGFKLKVLDYAFHHVPIFGLRAALAGTTAEEQSLMFVGDTLREVGTLIVKHLDHPQLLQDHADRLYNVVASRYSSDAGIDRLNRIFRA
jgi:glycosyltransferase involved in cell wall biosynthesis